VSGDSGQHNQHASFWPTHLLLLFMKYVNQPDCRNCACLSAQPALPAHTHFALSAMCYCSPEYCTASADGSVRIWDITSHQQLYEFGGSSASSRACGAPTAAAYHPRAYQLAVGYSTGLLRLFDVATTTLLLVSPSYSNSTSSRRSAHSKRKSVLTLLACCACLVQAVIPASFACTCKPMTGVHC
jgi:WD40 repeat protein